MPFSVALKKGSHLVHNFETRSTKFQHTVSEEKHAIAKRGRDSQKTETGSVSTIKKHEIESGFKDKKYHINFRKNSPKNVIESGMQTNPFGHLSELLGLKGSFIPSQSRQRWLADEEENRNEQRNDESSSLEKMVTHPEMDSSELSAAKGTLPLDVTPQQAALIASTADSNEQRRKFMDWEKQGGSMDTRHFPSTFIKGGDSTASKRVSTQRNPDAVSVSISQGVNSFRAEGGHVKIEDHRSDNVERILNELNPNADSLTTETNVAKHQPEPSQDKPEIYKDLENKDKKRFVGFMPNQFGVLDGNHGLSNEVLPGHSLFGSAMHDQPLTHDMINKLQLDPAWDAMEVKILAQHGQRVMPMQMPMTKIEKEMMPPDGIPVGQAYLPANHHLHSSMLENLQSDAGQAMAQGNAGGHAINVGGAIGKQCVP